MNIEIGEDGGEEVCEFKVDVNRGGSMEEVAEDIVYAKKERRGIVLKNVLGDSVEVEGAVIEEVDVEGERMSLLSSPLLSQIQEFIELHHRCLSDRALIDEVESSWAKVKALGEGVLAELRGGM